MLVREALPKFLAEITSLREKCPGKIILMSKAGVSDRFRNVYISPDQTKNYFMFWEMLW